MSLLSDCKSYLDITDNDRDSKITMLLNAAYSSMTNTADVATFDFSPTAESQTEPDGLLKITLFAYVAMELETDPDKKARWKELYENNVWTLATSNAFGDYSILSGGA